MREPVPRWSLCRLPQRGRVLVPLREREGAAEVCGEGVWVRGRVRGSPSLRQAPLREGVPCGGVRRVPAVGQKELPVWEEVIRGAALRQERRPVWRHVRATAGMRAAPLRGEVPRGPLLRGVPDCGGQELSLRGAAEAGDWLLACARAWCCSCTAPLSVSLVLAPSPPLPPPSQPSPPTLPRSNQEQHTLPRSSREAIKLAIPFPSSDPLPPHGIRWADSDCSDGILPSSSPPSYPACRNSCASGGASGVGPAAVTCAKESAVKVPVHLARR